MEIKLKNNIDFKDVECGDFIVNENGKLRMVVEVDEGMFNLINPTSGKYMASSSYCSIGILLGVYKKDWGIERIIKSKNMRLEEI